MMLRVRYDRRSFVLMAAALAAQPAWASRIARVGRPAPERRDLFPEGVASGDPDEHSVLLWTRRPYVGDVAAQLTVEVAEDERFQRTIASLKCGLFEQADWTCRVLVGNLRPGTTYWYRFLDHDGNASRVGRTRTAPRPVDGRPVSFAFVSCQNANLGYQQAYRRMIHEDASADPEDQIQFVLHLGDVVYETVWYPEDRPQGYNGREIRDLLRYPDGEKINDFHVPASLRDYRALHRAYLRDGDIQDARARWPFITIWDNHEFSRNGWQSLQVFDGEKRPAQTLKVAANQAWFEYQPARVQKSGGPDMQTFNAPAVENAAIETFDQAGFGLEPNNIAAVASLTGYRRLHWGRHIDLFVTDQRSYRSETLDVRPEMHAFVSADFPQLIPEEALKVLDAGRDYADGRPPSTLAFDGNEIANFRKLDPPQTLLGSRQKQWLIDGITASSARWKVWGNTLGALDYRCDPQNIPQDVSRSWPGEGYAGMRMGDFGSAYSERAEIYAAIRDAGVTGFTILSGDRHSFWAGLAAPALPPAPFTPVGVNFVTGSISSPGLMERLETNLSVMHPLRRLYVYDESDFTHPAPTVNLLFHHGVRSALEFSQSGDIEQARALSNAELSPHVSFLDFDGHGFATVRACAADLVCTFVAIARPVAPVAAADGGPVLYRVAHRVKAWREGEQPLLEQSVLEGNPALSL